MKIIATQLIAAYVAPVTASVIIDANTMLPLGVAVGTLLFVARLSARWAALETRLEMFTKDFNSRLTRLENEHSAMTRVHINQKNK